MQEGCPSKVSEVLSGQSCCMSTGIIHVDEHASPDLPPRSPPVLECDVKMGEDLAKDNLVDSHRPPDKLSVDQSF